MGKVLLFPLYLLLQYPIPFLITVGVITGVVVLIGIAVKWANRAAEAERRRQEEVKRKQQEAARQKKQHAGQRVAAQAAAKRRQQEQEKQRVDAFGKQGAALVKRAIASVQGIKSSEAASTGWLGDVDFTPDLAGIEANFREARDLRRKSDDLSALPKPNDDDRKIIAEAKTTIARLERKSKERVELLERCAAEAHLIDESLRRQREEARLAEKREELHGELAAMLYKVEAIEATTPAESAADAVMARVQAYRDIKGQIERAREDSGAPTDTENRADDSVSWIVDPIRQAWKWVTE